ncbi:MAG: aminoacyl--tRNA ligase-related protein [Patescibacteria group bacterium]
MKQSQLFTKTRFEAPKDEVAKNAEILIRAGFINKEMAGVYDFLPLGLRTLNKIINLIREEMNNLGGQEIFMSSLQRKELWERTGRWNDDVVDNWFKTKLKEGGDLGLGFTHEEPVANMLEQYVSSYKDLPFSVYQFQNKFRNETRAKSGIMRTREFIMKDLYSFNVDLDAHMEFYEKAKDAYRRIFDKVGIGHKTYLTLASGGSFSSNSHEFQTICDAGEDTIFITDEEKREAVNKEVDDRRETGHKAVEVGNIFSLGTKFSEPHLKFKNEKGEENPVFMGSYGIGPARLMGTIVEVLAKDNAMIWPESVAPFRVHIIDLSQGDESVKKSALDLYGGLTDAGIEALLDDREARAGEKFADADLIGIPHRIVVSKKTEAAGAYEYTNRIKAETSAILKSEIMDVLK